MGQIIRRLLFALFLCEVGFYVGGYGWHTLHGRYEPASIGLSGVKSYAWAPSGFVEDFRWDIDRMWYYYPIYCLDTSLWHTSYDARSGKYPINEVDGKEIGKVYRAWGLCN